MSHHTGEMYKAFDHLVDAVAPEGQLYIAIYNKVDGLFGSAHWHTIKKFYVRSAKPVKKIMEWGYVSYHFSRLLIRFKNPFTVMKSFYKKRGMSWKHDFIDWLGGFPYEYASLEQMFDYFCTKKGMKIENVKTTNYIGNNQLLLRK
jgi:hypothetical protein